MKTICPRSCTSFCGACFMFRLSVDHQLGVKFVPSLYSVVWEVPPSDICLESDQFTTNDSTHPTFDVYQNTRRYGTVKCLAATQDKGTLTVGMERRQALLSCKSANPRHLLADACSAALPLYCRTATFRSLRVKYAQRLLSRSRSEAERSEGLVLKSS